MYMGMIILQMLKVGYDIKKVEKHRTKLFNFHVVWYSHVKIVLWLRPFEIVRTALYHTHLDLIHLIVFH